MMSGFKSAATKRINALRGTPGPQVWQRDDYEHVIRNESALDRIRKYIADNPARWSKDPENPVVRDLQDPFGAWATGRSPLHYPEPLRTLGEIRDGIIALEKKPEGSSDENLRS